MNRFKPNYKKILFFFENDWAFGQIYQALSKRLWEHNIYAHVLDWRTSYTKQEFVYLMNKFDAVVTVTSVVNSLLSYDIPLSKIIAIAHSKNDINLGLERFGNRYDELLNYGVIHPHMIEISKSLGIKRIPKVVPNGLDFDFFYSPISESLTSIGYGGADIHQMLDLTDCKRAYLLPPIIEKTGLNLKRHSRMHFLCMSGYYQSVDSLLVTSNYEGCGLPAMEAAAAGRLVIGCQIGYFNGRYGLLCRSPDNEFVEDAVNFLELNKDPKIYKENCERAQQYAKDHLDWSHVLNQHLEFFS
jgi:hypothetical protein